MVKCEREDMREGWICQTWSRQSMAERRRGAIDSRMPAR
jgi:hypothetical protein